MVCEQMDGGGNRLAHRESATSRMGWLYDSRAANETACLVETADDKVIRDGDVQ